MYLKEILSGFHKSNLQYYKAIDIREMVDTLLLFEIK